MDKIRQLYYIIEKVEDGKQFFCDNELNRIYEFDYHLWHDEHEGDCQYFRCYLFTKDEIELIKKKVGDGNYLELDDINDEYPIGMYVIFTTKYEAWIKEKQRYRKTIGREWNYDKFEDEDVSEISFDFANSYDDFNDYFQELCDGSYFDGSLVRRALGKTRIYPDFIQAILNIYSKDYLKWWRVNLKSKKEEATFYDSDYSDDFEYYSRYDKYDGYNGYDDDTIDDAFDGFPEATWNVD